MATKKTYRSACCALGALTLAVLAAAVWVQVLLVDERRQHAELKRYADSVVEICNK